MKSWELFETLNEHVYVSDPHTYELIYMNRKCREFCGFETMDQVKGKMCCEVLQNSSTPCVFCSNCKLKKNEFQERVIFNPILKKPFAEKVTLIKEDGKEYRLEIAVNVHPQQWCKKKSELGYPDLHAVANEVLRMVLDQDSPDNSIQIILQFIGGLLSADRTYVFELNEEGSSDNTYEWTARGIQPEKDSLQKVPMDLLQGWYDHFKGSHELYIPNIEEVREIFPNQYEVLKRQNIKRLMVVPLMEGQKTIGFYGVDNPSEDSIEKASDILQIMAAFTVGGIKRRNLLHQIQLEESIRAEAAMAKRTQENLNMVNDIIGSGLWYMEFDRSGQMSRVSWSRKFREMLGFSSLEEFPDELESWSSRLHPDHKEQVLQAFWDCVDGRKEYDVKYMLRLKDGSYEWFHAHNKTAPYEDGTPRLFLGSFINITKELQAQQAIQSALEAANKANAAKSQFLSNMSHDMRTPLNGIIGMLEMEERNWNNRAKQIEYHQKIRMSAMQLLSLVNDVLDMSRLETGHTEFEDIDANVKELIEECLAITEAQALSRSIDMQVHFEDVLHPHILSSPVHLKRIVLNLVSNAIKFNHPGGRIDILLKELHHVPHETVFRFVIRDTGIGMAPEFLPHAFEAFSQEEGRARTDFQGTGLGLAIVKTTVEQMGGTITAESKEGEGTAFIITIPFAAGAEPAEPEVCLQEQEQKEASLEGRHVLLVEDNELNMEIAHFMLEEEGMIITPAYNGQEALAAYLNNPVGTFDLILMDLMMPVMDGLEAARCIRSSGRSDAHFIPIIALTANAFLEDAQRCLDAGMNGHIPKPIDMEAAVHKIAQAISH